MKTWKCWQAWQIFSLEQNFLEARLTEPVRETRESWHCWGHLLPWLFFPPGCSLGRISGWSLKSLTEEKPPALIKSPTIVNSSNSHCYRVSNSCPQMVITILLVFILLISNPNINQLSCICCSPLGFQTYGKNMVTYLFCRILED